MIRVLRKFDPRSIRLLVFDLDGTLIDSRLDLIHSVNAMLRHVERPELEGDVIASYVGDGAPVLVRRALFGAEGLRQVGAEREASGPAGLSQGAFGQAGDGADEQLFQEALTYFLGYYRMHKLDHTTVYDGIPEVLAALANGAARAEVGGAGTAGAKSAGAAGGAASRDAADVGTADAAGARVGKSVCPTRVMAVLSNKPVRPTQDIVSALGLGDYFVRVYGGNSFATKKPDPLGVRTLLEETGVGAEEALMIGDSGIDVQTGRNAGVWTCGVTYGFAPQTLEEVVPDVVVDGPRELGELLG
jgi:phosphoglycolate phosphatase